MEQNKYYIPEMEEFHYGFEYECLTPKGYVDTVFGVNVMPNPELNQYGDDEFMKLAHAITRVKYLDSDDLIELGFTQSQDKKDPFTGQSVWFKRDEHGFNTGTILEITLIQKGSILISWEIYGSWGGGSGNFQINIRNKTALKRLLKDLSLG